jgi:hypothetical protein
MGELWVRDAGQWKPPTKSDGAVRHLFDHTDDYSARKYPTVNGAYVKYLEMDTGLVYDPALRYQIDLHLHGQIGNTNSHNFRYNGQQGVAIDGHTGTYEAEWFTGDSGSLDGTQWQRIDRDGTVTLNPNRWTITGPLNIKATTWLKVTEDGTATETYQMTWRVVVTAWPQVDDVWVRSGGAWQRAVEIDVVSGGTWRT